jgi:transcriptional regulator with XRE-family HTH domain
MSTQEMEERLGEAVRRARIASGHSQADLASLAGISVSALGALENGHGSSTASLARVARALGRIDYLDGLAPPITISPLSIAQGGPPERRRVGRGRRPQP